MRPEYNLDIQDLDNGSAVKLVTLISVNATNIHIWACSAGFLGWSGGVWVKCAFGLQLLMHILLPITMS